tara:strand:- start:192 stop:1490 length:1299 start_codon:yes stop_codon:yes gene_type:complete
MIKKIVLFSFLLYFNTISAQKVRDTVMIDGHYFIEHIVSAGESIKKIARMYNVTPKDILDNNEIYKRIYYNQLLYIPFNKSDQINELVFKNEVKKDESVINIALLLPYYLTKNDTMFNVYEEEVDASRIYYNKSEAALSFHVGIELAIDSLRRAGKKIILHTFDTNRDSLTVVDLVYSNNLNKMDIIIGPLYSRLFRILCKRYGNDKKKILISPLSRKNKYIKQYSSVYQIAPSYKIQSDILANHLIKNCIDERILVLYDNESSHLLSSIKSRFRIAKKKIDISEIFHTEVDSIRYLFNPKQNVLLISSNKAFVSKMLSSIGSIDSTSTVYTFESVKSYDNLDITNLMELNVHIPNSSYTNYQNNFDDSFLRLFQKEFNTNVGKYTKTAYNLIMQFCGQTKYYKFKQHKKGYYENLNAPIYHYYDYGLTPLN